jgi:2-dehydro-3-deoxy-D-arabinonate dehydratase
VKLLRYATTDDRVHIGVERDGSLRRLPVPSLASLLSGDLERVMSLVADAHRVEEAPVRPLAPVDGSTEVWCAGVTYRRSRDARIEESKEADVYDRVYAAKRPELFFKAVAWRVSGPGEPIAIRSDSTMDVPEPELAVVVTSSGEVAGYTICDDVSSRSIEGQNPLYLPQAKVYEGGCALGPAILLAGSGLDAHAFTITLEIRRGGSVVWSGRTDTGELVRSVPDLVGWLFAELHFPAGAVLSTGTGIVPDLGFTLADGDEVGIAISDIGTLANRVVKGKAAMRWILERADATPYH